MRDLNFNPFKQEEVLEFDGKIHWLLDNNQYLNLYKKHPLLKSVVDHVRSKGIITKSARTKEQANYWLPGLNAGLPLTPKGDEIHEITFLFHDLIHHAIPDLVLGGRESKIAYVIHRMVGEAISMVLADMLFVHQIKSSGVQYDFAKRKIYPLYSENVPLKDIAYSVVRFALLGDCSMLSELADPEEIEAFKQKYTSFFIEDYRWTVANYERVKDNGWYELVEEFIPGSGYFSDLICTYSTYEDKVDAVFEELWSRLLTLKQEENTAFTRYAVGQMYQIVNNGGEIGHILDAIGDKNEVKTLLDEQFDLLSLPESFKEVAPMFPPFFVFYGSRCKYSSIQETVERLVLC